MNGLFWNKHKEKLFLDQKMSLKDYSMKYQEIIFYEKLRLSIFLFILMHLSFNVVEAKLGIDAGLLSNPSPSQSSNESVDCDYLCNILLKDGQVAGVNGAAGWMTSDDQYCADHGAQTNAAVSAQNPAQLYSAVCSVPLSDDEGGSKATAHECEATNTRVLRCKLRNTMAGDYCLAIAAAQAAVKQNIISVSLDAAAVAVCGALCAIEAVGVGWAGGAACTAIDLAAGISEIVSTTNMENSFLSKEIKNIISGIGIAGGMGVLAADAVKTLKSSGAAKGAADGAEVAAKAADEAAEAAAKAAKAAENAAEVAAKAADEAAAKAASKKAADAAAKEAADAAAKEAADKAAKAAAEAVEAAKAAENAKLAAREAGQEVAEKAAEKAGQEATEKAAEEAGTKAKMLERGLACATAAFYGVLLGVRTDDLVKTNDTVSSSCHSLQSLISQSTITGSGSGSTDLASQVLGSAKSAASDNSLTSSVQTRSSVNQTTTQARSLSALTSHCLSQLSQCLGASSAAASAGDVQTLLKSGGLEALTPVAANLANTSFASQLAAGASAGKALSSVLSSDFADSATGQSLARLIDRAQSHPQEGLALFPKGSIFLSGVKMPVKSVPTAPKLSLFSLGQDPIPLPSAEWTWNTPQKTATPLLPEEQDIWHTHTQFSLFEIVTQRIQKENSSVQHLGWDTPLNRALNGLPPQGDTPK